MWGIKVGPIIAGLGLFGVAVALGAQDLFKNLISGILVLVERRFEVGNVIEVEGVIEGVVEKYFKRTIELDKYEFDIEDLVNVYKCINNVEDIDDFDLERCDEVVRNFGLDKMRDVYFHNSRKLAEDNEDPEDLVKKEEKTVPMK